MQVQYLPRALKDTEVLDIPEDKLDTNMDPSYMTALTKAMKWDQRAAQIIAGAAMVNVKPNVLSPANDEALDNMDRKHFRDIMNRFTDKQYMSFINSENGDDPQKVANDITMIWRAFKGASENSEIYTISPSAAASELDVISRIIEDLPAPFPYTNRDFGKIHLARLLRRHELTYADFAYATGKSLMMNMQLRDGATASIKKFNDMENAFFNSLETLRNTLSHVWRSISTEINKPNNAFLSSEYYIDYIGEIIDVGMNMEALRNRKKPHTHDRDANTESPQPPATQDTAAQDSDTDESGPIQPIPVPHRPVPEEIYKDMSI